MRTVLSTCLTATLLALLISCKKSCVIYPSTVDQLKKQSFRQGSYWIYQDSASGIIDSQYVYDYSATNKMELGSNTSDGIICTAYGDAYYMGIASFRSGIIYDSISIGDNINGFSGLNMQVYYHMHSSESSIYRYSAVGAGETTILTNFNVSGRIFPKVYREVGSHNALAYTVDNIGVVKWVFNDTISGQNTWNLLRYHVIIP